MSNPIIKQTGKGSKDSNAYAFKGNFQKGQSPTLLDSEEAQRVKRFIENIVFRSIFRINTGSPDKNLFRLDMSDPGQAIWELDLRTALSTDWTPKLGGDLDMDGYGFRANIAGTSNGGPYFWQHADEGFTVVPQNWPSASTLGGKIRLGYDAYTAGFQAPELTSASVNLILPTTQDVGDAILMSAIGGEMGWSEITAGSGITVTRDGRNFEITSTSSGGSVTEIDGEGTSGITVTGGPITTSGTLTVDLDDTAVTPATYGDASNVAQFTVDQQGRITSATDVTITGGSGTVTSITPGADSGTGTAITTSGTITVSGDTGITTAVSGTTIEVDLDDTAVTPATYGDATKVSQITIDQQGRITSATDVTITSGAGSVTSVDVDGASTGLTFGGGPITTSGTITMGGTLAANYGGTGFDVYTKGDILYANTTSTLAKLGIGGDGEVLTVDTDVPSWSAAGSGTVTSIDVDGAATGLTFGGGPITDSGTITMGGILAANYGGTGFDAFTKGDILYADTTSSLAKLGIGGDGEVLTVDTDVPSWSTAGAGTVTSVDVAGGATGLTFGGGPITDSGTITMGGILAANYGGTGFDAFTKGDILYADTTSSLAKLGIGGDGEVLTVDTDVPSWAAAASSLFPISGEEDAFLTLDSSGNPQDTVNLLAKGGAEGATKYIGWKDFYTSSDQYSMGMFETPDPLDPQAGKEGLTIWRGDASNKDQVSASIYTRTVGVLNMNQVSIGHDVHYDDPTKNGLDIWSDSSNNNAIIIRRTDPVSDDTNFAQITYPGSDGSSGVLQMPSDNMVLVPGGGGASRRVLMGVVTDAATLASEVMWGDCLVADGKRNATYPTYDTGLWAGEDGDETALGNGDQINVVGGTDIDVTRSGGEFTIDYTGGGGGGSGTVTSVAGTGTSGITVTGGPITTSGTLTVDLDDTAVTPATYGDANNVAVITVDQQGRITAASETAIAGGGGAPVGATYVCISADGTLTNERVLTAGTNITITDAGAGGNVTIAASGGGGAPDDAQYVTLATDGDLDNERVLTAGTGITITDGGAGGTVTIAASGGGGGMSSFICTEGANPFTIDSSNNTLTFAVEPGQGTSWDFGVGGTAKLNIATGTYMKNFYLSDGAESFEVDDNDTVEISSSDGFVMIDMITEDIVDITDGLSDERVKDDVQPLQGSWEKLQKLQPVGFNWNTNAPKELEFCKDRTGGTRDFGLVAQDVEKVLPEIVGTRRDGKKTIKYSRLTPLLLDTIQELKAEIGALKDRIDLMEHSQQ